MLSRSPREFLAMMRVLYMLKKRMEAGGGLKDFFGINSNIG